ncbi:type IV pilus modification PilV family protein [Deinococcus cellulosilyticus]|uniref:type IV pilus modification PilV family protein n=1 Tax=Deinococcus cellulosilyticus TaxID=401558 RepID=UPI0011BE3D71|nr:prepilin-type N-terminal cleavage/methylation domain-containing protein [Deinococcus cellulosilyticus]
MSTERSSSRTCGLTLMEVLMALSLLGVMFLCLLPVQSSSLRASRQASEVQKAALLLSSHLHSLKGLKFDQVVEACASRPWSSAPLTIRCTSEPCTVQQLHLICPGFPAQALQVRFSAWKNEKHLLDLHTVIAQ